MSALATKDHSDQIERKIMKGRHMELHYEFLTENGQYWTDYIVQSILYKLVKFRSIQELITLKAFGTCCICVQLTQC